ncbi:hypothetical protein [Agromyces mariniharenae]|uniref:DUF4386 family protein n=1 Tax=Agromyces mariniharenae TaxID=2604423 RepID=A0A5S4V713_9MICO|nr:hypothetical protein [Agromyces mariniharenae]TYL53091.1 hypothetical protein FYC51_05120 [Agromyces mariniharenae]
MMTTPSTTTTTTLTPSGDRTAPSGPAARDERRLLFCGVLVGATYLIGMAFITVFFATSHPAMDATPVEAAVGFRDAAGMVGLATFLGMLPLPFALLFLGGLDTVLRRVAGGPLVPAAISAGVLSFLIPAIGMLVSAVTPAIGAADTSAAAGAVVKALDGVMPLSVALSGFPRAVLVVAVLVLLARAGLAGRVLGVAGYGIAGLGIIGTGTFLAQGLFPVANLSALLFVAWVTTLAVVLLRRATVRVARTRAA